MKSMHELREDWNKSKEHRELRKKLNSDSFDLW